MEDQDGPAAAPDSLLPYDAWMQDALREVMLRALEHAASEGLPGEHHFYVTFRTDNPATIVPDRVRAKYPTEMTIVLQHQFDELAVDRDAGLITVRLSFGGVSSRLAIPVGAVTAFADPAIRFGLRFTPADTAMPAEKAPEAPADAPSTPPDPTADAAPQVVSLDAFRRRRD